MVTDLMICIQYIHFCNVSPNCFYVNEIIQAFLQTGARENNMHSNLD